MTTLIKHMIVVGAENRPPKLDKTMYNSWQIHMLLYIKGKKNGRMMLKSIENRPLVYPTIEEDGKIRDKKYAELTKQEKLQDECDVQATNIVLQDLPLDVYSLVNYCKAAKDIWDRVKLLMQGLVVPSFLLGDDLISCLNKAMEFMSTVMESRFPSTNNQLRTSSNLRNQATIQDGRVTVQQGEGHMELDEEQFAFLANPRVVDSQDTQTTILHNAALHTNYLDAYDSDSDDISLAKAILIANLSRYDSNVLFEYLQQTQNAIVQDTNSFAQQDSMIISMFEQMSEQMSNHVTKWDKVNQETKTVNESLTAKLERYKERVKAFEQRLNVDLSSREKFIASQIDDMIQNRNALKKEIDSLKQTLFKQVKEKELLLQTFTIFKKESKGKENKYMDKEIDVEKKGTG
ncbi:hypothetical protein Tco_1338205 [Tanacetum coccineum]